MNLFEHINDSFKDVFGDQMNSNEFLKGMQDCASGQAPTKDTHEYLEGWAKQASEESSHDIEMAANAHDALQGEL